jgi:hypothetical protein
MVKEFEIGIIKRIWRRQEEGSAHEYILLLWLNQMRCVCYQKGKRGRTCGVLYLGAFILLSCAHTKALDEHHFIDAIMCILRA